MQEDSFVQEALAVATDVLKLPLFIRQSAALLYEITVNSQLQITIDPRYPARGQSAFQTDLCVFETLSSGVELPRVVLEFKSRLTTHDILTYSAKAHKHKQIYPHLRYGLVIANIDTIPSRFFKHNEALDFCIAAATFRAMDRVHDLFSSLLQAEVDASRRLERIAFEKARTRIFRTEIVLEEVNDTVL